MPAQKSLVVQKLRHDSFPSMVNRPTIPCNLLLSFEARMENLDKYQEVKKKIKTIYHENKGRYGYRRITAELHNRGFHLNHKTIQRLMKQLGLICRVRAKKYRSYC